MMTDMIGMNFVISRDWTGALSINSGKIVCSEPDEIHGKGGIRVQHAKPLLFLFLFFYKTDYKGIRENGQ